MKKVLIKLKLCFSETIQKHSRSPEICSTLGLVSLMMIASHPDDIKIGLEMLSVGLFKHYPRILLHHLPV